MMPGGDMEAYLFVKPVLESIAAKVNGDACVTYIGPGASGHFVKMVHNGIEYALMQLIADTYEILKKGLKLNNEKIHEGLRIGIKASCNRIFWKLLLIFFYIKMRMAVFYSIK
jgi:6-phosphogluconate dehydrogenase